MPAILYVRIKSGLDFKELERRLLERRPRFRGVAGLIQKIYGRNETTGELCGIYFFENREDLATIREAQLAQTIYGRLIHSRQSLRNNNLATMSCIG